MTTPTYKQHLIDRAKQIKGWMRDDELGWLFDNATDKKLVIEFGSWHGRSAIAMLGAARVVCCDKWTTEHGLLWGPGHMEKGLPFLQFFDNLRLEITRGQVIPYVTALDNEDFIDRLVADYGGKADMVFIDADHLYDGVVRDIKTARKLLKPGGLLCGHDYGERDWPGVKKAVDELCTRVVCPAGKIWVSKNG